MANGTDPGSQATALVNAWDNAQECLVALNAKVDADCERLVLDFAGKAGAPSADDYVNLQGQLQGLLDKGQKQRAAIEAVVKRIVDQLQALAKVSADLVAAAVNRKVAALQEASAKAAMDARIQRLKDLIGGQAAPAAAPRPAQERVERK